MFSYKPQQVGWASPAVHGPLFGDQPSGFEQKQKKKKKAKCKKKLLSCADSSAQGATPASERVTRLCQRICSSSAFQHSGLQLEGDLGSSSDFIISLACNFSTYYSVLIVSLIY